SGEQVAFPALGTFTAHQLVVLGGEQRLRELVGQREVGFGDGDLRGVRAHGGGLGGGVRGAVDGGGDVSVVHHTRHVFHGGGLVEGQLREVLLQPGEGLLGRG